MVIHVYIEECTHLEVGRGSRTLHCVFEELVISVELKLRIYFADSCIVLAMAFECD